MAVDRIALARKLVVERMNALAGEWREEGELVRGPGPTAVLVRDHAGMGHTAASIGHVDLGFMLNVERDDVPVIWDCATGLGESPEASLRQAIDIWAQCTAVVVIELFTREGQFAEHAMGGDGLGLDGWHGILGPVLGRGASDAVKKLQQWVLDHPLLPQLKKPLRKALPRDELNGVKFFFGSLPQEDVAEVRINGEEHRECSKALAELDWPRFDEPAFVRCFVLLVHPVDADMAHVR